MGFLSSMTFLHKLLGTLHACIDISHYICRLKLKLMPVRCFVTAITATKPLLTRKLNVIMRAASKDQTISQQSVCRPDLAFRGYYSIGVRGEHRSSIINHPQGFLFSYVIHGASHPFI